jgi:hypothetical protein
MNRISMGYRTTRAKGQATASSTMRRLRKGTTELDVLRDLMLGGRHSRQTVIRFGVSYPTADRWLASLLRVPGVRRFKMGKTMWYEWEPTSSMVLEARRSERASRTV